MNEIKLTTLNITRLLVWHVSLLLLLFVLLLLFHWQCSPFFTSSCSTRNKKKKHRKKETIETTKAFLSAGCHHSRWQYGLTFGDDGKHFSKFVCHLKFVAFLFWFLYSLPSFVFIILRQWHSSAIVIGLMGY